MTYKNTLKDSAIQTAAVVALCFVGIAGMHAVGWATREEGEGYATLVVCFFGLLFAKGYEIEHRRKNPRRYVEIDADGFIISSTDSSHDGGHHGGGDHGGCNGGGHH